MYLHNNEHANNDTVQLVPEYNPDTDSNNNDTLQNPICTMASTNRTMEYEQNISDLLDANSPEPDTTQSRDNLPETDWPDAPTVQIPWVSSTTTTDLPPEVQYHRKTTIYPAHEEEVPELEEDENQEEYNNNHHLITHHNTHQESGRIRREYTERLQKLDDQQYHDQVDRTPELQYFYLMPHMIHQSQKPYQQLINRLHKDPQTNYINYSAGDGERQGKMNYIVIAPTEPVQDHSKVEYSGK